MKKIGFTRGTFQILHAGHVQFLERAKSLVDELYVLIDSDDRVKKLKGECLVSAGDRQAILLALRDVNGVFTFDSEESFQGRMARETPWNQALYLYFKGGDYKPNDLPEKEFLESRKVIVTCLTHSGHSTTDIVKKIRNGPPLPVGFEPIRQSLEADMRGNTRND
jgi:cytidyltransferase-like protein